MLTLERTIKNSSKTSQTILKLDWQKFMKQINKNYVDLILTDPPYTISRATGFSKVGKNSIKRFAISMDFGKWDKKQINLNQLCYESYRILKRGGTAIIWYDLWKIGELQTAMINAGFKMIRLIIWQKTNPVPLNQSAIYLSNSREVAVVGVKVGKPTFYSKYDNGIYYLPIPRHNGHRIHPTQKPLDLFTQLIIKHSNRGDFIIDPFLGSGTTAVAAIKQDRRFQGCDIDPVYVKTAQLRIASLD